MRASRQVAIQLVRERAGRARGQHGEARTRHTGMERAKAMAWAAAAAIRTPVKLPGPQPNATKSRSARVAPESVEQPLRMLVDALGLVARGPRLPRHRLAAHGTPRG